MSLFYPLDEPYKGVDSKKREFVAVRMESDLFRQLTAVAQERDSDLSSVIRDMCRQQLEG